MKWGLLSIITVFLSLYNSAVTANDNKKNGNNGTSLKRDNAEDRPYNVRKRYDASEVKLIKSSISDDKKKYWDLSFDDYQQWESGKVSYKYESMKNLNSNENVSFLYRLKTENKVLFFILLNTTH